MTNFTLRQLEVFTIAAQYRSFALAAKSLSMSKPAITKQIQALEAQVGAPLFKKRGRSMVMTDIGKQLFDQAQKVINETDFLKNIIALGTDSNLPLLRFSVGHSFSKLLFTAINHFAEQNVFEYQVSIDTHAEQTRKIEEGEVDIVITGIKLPDPRLVNHPFRKAKFCLVAAKSNPLTKQQNLIIDDVASQQFIQLKPKQQLQKVLLTKYNLVQDTFKRIMQLESYYAILEAIKADLGIGILPENLIDDQTHALTILPLKEFQFSRQLYVVTNKDNSEIKQRFLDFLGIE